LKVKAKILDRSLRRREGLVDIHVKGHPAMQESTLADAMKELFERPMRVRPWSQNNATGVYLSVPRKEVWNKCRKGSTLIKGQTCVIVAAHSSSDKRIPLATRTTWEVTAGHWPTRQGLESDSELFRRRQGVLTKYQDALASSYLQIVFEDPRQGSFQKGFHMPVKMNGGATGFCYVLSSKDELEDAAIVCAKYGSEAKTVGLTIQGNEVVKALKMMGLKGSPVTDVLMLQASNVGNATVTQLEKAALSSAQL
jgi:hypothetical protein